MKIFFDTNIVLEFLQQRKQADIVEKVLDITDVANHELFISSGSFYTMTYLIEQHLRRTTEMSHEERMSELRHILLGVLDVFQIVPHNNSSLRQGVENIHFDDLEDSYQVEAAIIAECDILLTINIKDFQGFKDATNLKVMTPTAFVEQFS